MTLKRSKYKGPIYLDHLLAILDEMGLGLSISDEKDKWDKVLKDENIELLDIKNCFLIVNESLTNLAKQVEKLEKLSYNNSERKTKGDKKNEERNTNSDNT